MDLPALLPDDVLAGVLRRLAPRGIVASRCVCKAWRALIDAHPLLRAELLPRSLAGILINFQCEGTKLFSRPSTSPSIIISGEQYEYLDYWVYDHCNGLLLSEDYVVNPATNWCSPLPPQPPAAMESTDRFEVPYLVYDPTVSPHYQVFLIPEFRSLRDQSQTNHVREQQSEWPPSPYMLHVFSSATGRWEERSFVRQGEAVGTTIADMRLESLDSSIWQRRDNVFWRGSLYVHCQSNYVMRISLSNDTYQLIEGTKPGFDYLGKSEKGVYAARHRSWYRFQVWFLEESSCQTRWVLKHEMNLLGWFLKHKSSRQQLYPERHVTGPWILQDDASDDEDDTKETLLENKFEWSSEASDDDGKFDCSSNNDDATVPGTYYGSVSILGFHPFKEIVFLNDDTLTRGLAYHLNTSKVEDLGNIYPSNYERWIGLNEQSIYSSFPYTPCWL